MGRISVGQAWQPHPHPESSSQESGCKFPFRQKKAPLPVYETYRLSDKLTQQNPNFQIECEIWAAGMVCVSEEHLEAGGLRR